MKNLTKKLLSFFLVVTMILGVFPMSALADGKEEESECFKVIAPAGSTVSVGNMKGYYVFTFQDVVDNGTLDDDRVWFEFAPTSGESFIRVQNPNGVTYWNYDSYEAGDEVEITDNQLFIDSTEFSKNTVYHNWEYNTLDTANIYANVNSQNYLTLANGESFELNMFRNWFAINSFMNNQVALPDMEYEVINFDGTKSDVVTIDVDENNSCVATVNANKKGTAVILVTYEAMTFEQACVSDALGYPTQNKELPRFSAIWPENTAVIVVSVEEDGTTVPLNMTINSEVESVAAAIDAEMDFVYYYDDKGAEFTFTPEEGTTVEVAKGTITNGVLGFNGFTDVSANSDGSVTLTGLTEGRHIVKVTKDGISNYQVITAKDASYSIQDEDGNILTESQLKELDPGDTIVIQFGGLENSIGKLSGIYNTNCTPLLTDGTNTFTGSAGSTVGVYNFASRPELQKVIVTIPEDYAEDTWTLYGYLKFGGFGNSGGGHRGITYEEGAGANTNAPGVNAFKSSLPAIDIAVRQRTDNNAPLLAEGVSSTAKADVALGDEYTIDLSEIFTDADGDTLTYTAKIGDGEATATETKFSYTPAKEGEIQLEFTANDGQAECAYIVNLTVGAAPIEDIVHNTGAMGNAPVLKTITIRGVNGEITKVEDSTNLTIEVEEIPEDFYIDLTFVGNAMFMNQGWSVTGSDIEGTQSGSGGWYYWKSEPITFAPENGTMTITLTSRINMINLTGTYTFTFVEHTCEWGEVNYTWSEDNKLVTAKRVCTTNESHVEDETVSATYAVVADAKCEEKGLGRWTAAFENEAFEVQTRDTDIDATGHTEAIDKAVAATCTESGLTEGKHCSVCGDVLTSQNEIAPLGHTWDEGKVTTEPTLKETGVKTYTCVCGTTKTDVIPTTGAELSKNELSVAENLGLTAQGAKEIIAYAEKKGIPQSLLYVTEKTIKKQESEDVKYATYAKLSAKASKVKKNQITVSWKKVKDADGYLIFGNKCGTKNKYKLLKTVSAKKTSYTQKKLKKGTYYKYLVVAYKLVDGKKVTIAASKTIHAATTGGKYTNAKSVKVNKTTVTVKKNKTIKIKASVVKVSKKLTVKTHKKLAFESSNKAIATVTASGKVKGIKKGTCYIYVYAQNGVYRRVKVKVK